MRPRLSRTIAGSLAALALVAIGCERAAAPTAPAPHAPASLLVSALSGSLWRQLACDPTPGVTARGVIGPRGGSLVAAGFRVDFPEGAVEADQEFVLTVVAGSARQIEAHAVERGSFQFAQPVTVTMDLRGCGPLRPSALHAWYLDPQSGRLLEDMGGTVDVIGERLRFHTPHFSGYTIAWRTEPEEGESERDTLP